MNHRRSVTGCLCGPLRVVAVPSKTNEITALRQLVDPIDLEGRLVEMDALHTQDDLSKALRSTLPVKVRNKSAKPTFQFHSSKKSAELAFSPAIIIQPLVRSCLNRRENFS